MRGSKLIIELLQCLCIMFDLMNFHWKTIVDTKQFLCQLQCTVRNRVYGRHTIWVATIYYDHRQTLRFTGPIIATRCWLHWFNIVIVKFRTFCFIYKLKLTMAMGKICFVVLLVLFNNSQIILIDSLILYSIKYIIKYLWIL